MKNKVMIQKNNNYINKKFKNYKKKFNYQKKCKTNLLK